MGALTTLALVAFLAGGATAHGAETVLVQSGSSMTYLANSSDPGLATTWKDEAFTPSGWASGIYGVGYGSNAALHPTTVASGTYSVYTRAAFTIADVSAVDNLFLGADYDDGYIAWINGVEVYRAPQMPGGAPDWNTVSSSHESSNAATPDYGPLQDVTAAALGALHNGTNVLAVGVWNTGLPSSDMVLVPYLAMNRETSVSRGPYLQLGTPTSVTVRWRTTLPTDSCVLYGAAPGSLLTSECSVAVTTEHSIELTGLTADTTYYYAVGSSTDVLEGDSADYVFTTSPLAGSSKPTRVWVLGDSGTANSDAEAVRDAYLTFTGATPTDLWLMLGDNAYNDGTDAQYQAAVFDMYPSVLRQSVLWPTLGNHDGYSADSATQSGPYYDLFTLPTGAEAGGLASGTEAYYSFDYGDIHFICLDSYETDRSLGGDMLDWLDADLADTTAQWIVVFFHHPPYSKGSHDSDTEGRMIEMRENVLPLLEAGGVDLVLTGHSHSYERTYLIDGHYDDSVTFNASMQVDAGSGRIGDTGAYEKTGGGPVANEGAVYIVAGSSGKVSAAALDHAAMFISFAELGSLVMDFDDDQLDVQFLDDLGVQRDDFTILKATPAVCGNGIPESGEECDDGNAVETDACLSSCVNASCGDGIVHGGVEDCDDANLDNTDACLDNCVAASCGDGFVRTGVEDCDDGNADNTDSCLDTCVGAACGDGFVQAGLEACDDGNTVPGDGCSDLCEAECEDTPRLDCLEAGTSVLRIQYTTNAGRNQLKWLWRRGAAFDALSIGNPTVDALYSLCLYPDSPGAGTLHRQVSLPTGPSWTSRGDRGYLYRDKAASVGGLRDLRLNARSEGRSKIVLKAKGLELATDLLPATGAYTLQLVDSQAGGCWTSAFADGDLTATSFKGKTVAP